MTAHPAQLALLAGADRASLLRVGLVDSTLPDDVVMLAASRRLLAEGGAAGTVATELIRSGRRVRVVAPPETTVGAWLRAPAVEWSAVDVEAKASRLSRVWLPSPLVEARALLLVNELTGSGRANEPIAIGVWAGLAHPRQRTGARLSGDRDGLAAEIALAVKPAAILLFADWNGMPLLIASDDQIAAELAALALRGHLRPGLDEPLGPWEHPLVQRATELELGVATPNMIAAERRWLGDDDNPDRRQFEELAARLLARIGVAVKG